MQERVESDQTENFIVHESLDRFIINSHAFHNAHLLRATLPRDLLAPIPLFEDRKVKHEEFAATLRVNWASKAAKRKAAAAEKPTTRKRKAPAAPVDSESDEDEDRAGSSNKRRRKTNAPLAPEPSLEAGGLLASRPRRTITQTEKAKATEKERTERDDDMESSEDDNSLYKDSDDDYSD